MPVTCSRHTYVGHLQCPECKKEAQSEVGLLRARVAELEGDAATVRELIDLLIENCPESHETIKNFAHNVIQARKV
jgi:hypothetical protein